MSNATKTTGVARLSPPHYWLYEEDCLTATPRLLGPDKQFGPAMLICEDPPYNLGQAYSDYVDRKTQREFLDFLEPRVKAGVDALHPNGSYWLAMNDANVAEVKVMCQDLGLYLRKWVIWAYSFGQNCKTNLTSGHTHWLYFTRHRTKFTFNYQAPELRVPSSRQMIYNDKRANSKGRLPDDVWVLRPQFVQPAPAALVDNWFFSRVCGTFKARAVGVSPNQMPVPLMSRIIGFCSNPGDLVVDRFVGSGSTGEAALLSGRKFVGTDVSRACVEYADKRLKATLKTTGVK